MISFGADLFRLFSSFLCTFLYIHVYDSSTSHTELEKHDNASEDDKGNDKLAEEEWEFERCGELGQVSGQEPKVGHHI